VSELELFMSQIRVYARSAINVPMIRAVAADALKGARRSKNRAR
jgi:hypothetical protein